MIMGNSCALMNRGWGKRMCWAKEFAQQANQGSQANSWGYGWACIRAKIACNVDEYVASLGVMQRACSK